MKTTDLQKARTVPPVAHPEPLLPPTATAAGHRIRRLLFGKPRDLADRSLFKHITLLPFLAWVGLGADGLSSSSYGPMEAFLTLGEHSYLAVALAAMSAATVFIIATAYSHIIEEFPHGGGGYVVATHLLGPRWGVISGSALLIDYVLTITVSIAAAGDAIFSFIPASAHSAKMGFELSCILGLIILNIRGVKESVEVLLPIFLLFLATHAILLVGGIVAQASTLPDVMRDTADGFRTGLSPTGIGAGAMALLFLHAYSLGGGTYTGIEAVSNGMPIMQEPRVRNGKRTMFYMATSLAITAGGLLLCYLLWDVGPVAGKTLNAVLAEKMVVGIPLGSAFVFATLVSEGGLLVVAAQAGFIDGPRVLANMAVDSWVPRRFASLSERLTTQNGIVLMGVAAVAALLYTSGNVVTLVVMYSINVFLTFSLSMFAMARTFFARRLEKRSWKRRFALFSVGFALCATILVITSFEKFADGGWVTLSVTGGLVVLCFVIRNHYRTVGNKLDELYAQLGSLPMEEGRTAGKPDPGKPTAVILVGNYGGIGIHTMLNAFRSFPGHFRNLVFVSVGVIDSGGFKGEETIDALRRRTEETLQRYVDLARGLGIPAAYRYRIGTETVEEAEKLCRRISEEFHGCMFFAGKVIFQRERWYQRILHNETAYLIQKRLQWAGLTMVIIPARLR